MLETDDAVSFPALRESIRGTLAIGASANAVRAAERFVCRQEEVVLRQPAVTAQAGTVVLRWSTLGRSTTFTFGDDGHVAVLIDRAEDHLVGPAAESAMDRIIVAACSAIRQAPDEDTIDQSLTDTAAPKAWPYAMGREGKSITVRCQFCGAAFDKKPWQCRAARPGKRWFCSPGHWHAFKRGEIFSTEPALSIPLAIHR